MTSASNYTCLQTLLPLMHQADRDLAVAPVPAVAAVAGCIRTSNLHQSYTSFLTPSQQLFVFPMRNWDHCEAFDDGPSL